MATVDHQPLPYQDNASSLFGIRCTCGTDFKQGDEYRYTVRGRWYTKEINCMRRAWEAYRMHWIATMGGDKDGVRMHSVHGAYTK